MKAFLLGILCFLLFKNSATFSQEAMEWHNYTSGNYINCIKPNEQKIWVGTKGGLVCIDEITGETKFYNRSNSGLPSNRILSLDYDSKGNLWIGTAAGIVKYDYITWEIFDRYNTGLNLEYIFELAVDSTDTIWAGSYNGLYRYDQNKWKVYNTSNSDIPGDYVTALTIDKNNNIWMGIIYDDGMIMEQPKGIVKFDGKTWTNYTMDNSDLPSDMISSLSVSDNNEILIGFYGIFSIFDENTWKIYNTSNSNIQNKYVSDICLADDKYWIGFMHGTVMTFDTVNGFKNPGINYNSIGDNIITLASANNNILYLGTDNGFASFDGTTTLYLNTSNSGLRYNNIIESVSIDNYNTKWFCTDIGLSKFDGRKWSLFTTDNSDLPFNTCFAVEMDSKGKIWIGTLSGLAVIKNDEWTIYNTENSVLPDNHIYEITIDKNDVVWLGTGRNIVKVDGESWTVLNPPNLNEAMVNWEQSILVDKENNLWIARIGAGIVRFDGENWIHYTKANSGLPDETIYTMAQDSSGNIWIGSNGGLTKFFDDEWTTYDTSNSDLSSIYIYTIVIDSNDDLWIGTHLGGLVKFDRTNWTIFNTKNSGIAGNTILSLALDLYENIWIGTFEEGVSVFKDGGIVNIWKKHKISNIFNNLKLYQNYPNPFNPKTTINYDLSNNHYVDLSIYNILGQKLITLVSENQKAGRYLVEFDGSYFPSGIYFYRLQAGNFIQTRRMLLIK